MRGLKWLDRRLSSPITPTMMSIPGPTYPPPPYIAPTKCNLIARDDCQTVRKAESVEIPVDDDVESLAALLCETETDIAPSRPNVSDHFGPRRDSETLETDSGVSVSSLRNEILQKALDGDGEPRDIDLQPQTPASTVVAPSLITIAPPDRTWHSAVASWKTTVFAQEYGFDLVYVIHVDEELDHQVPFSKFQTRYHTSSTGKPLRGQLLAAYGLHDMTSPMRLPLHESILQAKYTEREADAAGPNDLSYGLTYTFCRGRGGRTLCHYDMDTTTSTGDSRISRGIVLAAYRKDKNGAKLCEEAAEYFVDCLIDLYVWNGSHSLLLDARTEQAERLGVTAACRDSMAVCA